MKYMNSQNPDSDVILWNENCYLWWAGKELRQVRMDPMWHRFYWSSKRQLSIEWLVTDTTIRFLTRSQHIYHFRRCWRLKSGSPNTWLISFLRSCWYGKEFIGQSSRSRETAFSVTQNHITFRPNSSLQPLLHYLFSQKQTHIYTHRDTHTLPGITFGICPGSSYFWLILRWSCNPYHEAKH